MWGYNAVARTECVAIQANGYYIIGTPNDTFSSVLIKYFYTDWIAQIYLSKNDDEKADKSNSGSNTNGYYCKMSDGTLIQYASISFAQGGTNCNWTFPVGFSTIAYSVSGITLGALTGIYVLSGRTQSKISFSRTTGGSELTVTVIAVGRWK